VPPISWKYDSRGRRSRPGSRSSAAMARAAPVPARGAAMPLVVERCVLSAFNSSPSILSVRFRVTQSDTARANPVHQTDHYPDVPERTLAPVARVLCREALAYRARGEDFPLDVGRPLIVRGATKRPGIMGPWLPKSQPFFSEIVSQAEAPNVSSGHGPLSLRPPGIPARRGRCSPSVSHQTCPRGETCTRIVIEVARGSERVTQMLRY